MGQHHWRVAMEQVLLVEELAMVHLSSRRLVHHWWVAMALALLAEVLAMAHLSSRRLVHHWWVAMARALLVELLVMAHLSSALAMGFHLLIGSQRLTKATFQRSCY